MLRTKSKIILISLATLIMLLYCSCNTTEPGKRTESEWFSLDDISCTEAWLKIAGSVEYEKVIINRDGKEILNFKQPINDTIIYNTDLEPGKNYTFQAFRKSADNTTENSLVITGKTYDTTSHNFTWQTFVVGDALMGGINDIAIINDTLIYAVGAIFPRYISEPHAYCLAEWNGKSWQLKRLYDKEIDYLGNEAFLNLSNIYGIHVINQQDIWLTTASVFHWNNKDTLAELFIQHQDLNTFGAYLMKTWGASANDVYCAGYLGTIVHISNGSWKRIESGTTLNINDIYGNYDNIKNQSEIIAVGSNVGSGSGNFILQIDKEKAKQLSTSGIITNGDLISIWFSSDRAYYVAGNGLYYKHKITDSTWSECRNVMRYYGTDVCGNGFNDVFATSYSGDIVHFNGNTWQNYYTQIPIPGCYFGQIESKGNTVVVVGYSNRDIVLVVGKRQP